MILTCPVFVSFFFPHFLDRLSRDENKVVDPPTLYSHVVEAVRGGLIRPWEQCLGKPRIIRGASDLAMNQGAVPIAILPTEKRHMHNTFVGWLVNDAAQNHGYATGSSNEGTDFPCLARAFPALLSRKRFVSYAVYISYPYLALHVPN